MISQEQAGDAIRFLASTDDEAAIKKRAMLAAEYVMKRTKAHEFLNAKGAQGERNNIAECSSAYQEKVKLYTDAFCEFEAIRNKRATAEIQFEAWRSLNANRRQAGG